MMVGRDVLWIDTKAGIAVALRHVPEHLVIGLVLLEDVEDVLENGGLADVQRHWDGSLPGQGRLLGLLDLRNTPILISLRGQLAQRVGVRNGNPVGGAQERIDLPGSRGWLPGTAAEA